MPQYKVRSTIRQGKATDKFDAHDLPIFEEKVYEAGSTIELEESEAYKIRHALEDPPARPANEPNIIATAKKARSEGGDDLEDPEQEAALESIRRRPDNPESGVHLHWQSPAETAEPPIRARSLEVGKGLERVAMAEEKAAEQALASPLAVTMPRPYTNVTEMEKESAKEGAEGPSAPAGGTPPRPSTGLPSAPAAPAKPANPIGSTPAPKK